MDCIEDRMICHVCNRESDAARVIEPFGVVCDHCERLLSSRVIHEGCVCVVSPIERAGLMLKEFEHRRERLRQEAREICCERDQLDTAQG